MTSNGHQRKDSIPGAAEVQTAILFREELCIVHIELHWQQQGLLHESLELRESTADVIRCLTEHKLEKCAVSNYKHL